MPILNQNLNPHTTTTTDRERKLGRRMSHHLPDYFRRCLEITCKGLSIGHCRYRPHSLRHGGATHAQMHLNQSIEQIMFRGRWKSNSTCRTYIQSGTAALLTLSIDPNVVSLTSEVMQDWYLLLSSLCFHSS